jgi:thiamine-phosphate pyrophosphorylase
MRSSRPLLCYITDRQALVSGDILALISAAIETGVDLIQIREKDLGTRGLMRLVEAAVEGVREKNVRSGPSAPVVTRVIVNERLDVALASGAGGVHLGGESLPAPAIRAVLEAREDFWVGVSCHSPEEASAAEAAGADYVVLGPIFETASKLRYGPPLGLGALERASRHSRIPILALGGITLERVGSCMGAGAAGIAGISIFQQCASLSKRVRQLRRVLGAAVSTCSSPPTT